MTHVRAEGRGFELKEGVVMPIVSPEGDSFVGRGEMWGAERGDGGL